MARDYADLIASDEGGVYLALSAPSMKLVENAALASQIATRRSSSGGWQFLSFPPASPAAAIFFGFGNMTVQDPDSALRHRPDVVGLREVWMEGDATFTALLKRLGAIQCGQSHGPGGVTGERWTLARGEIVVLPARNGARPRVRGVSLDSRVLRDSVVYPLSGFWIRYLPTMKMHLTADMK
jgi:hypothetical protein